MSLSPSACCVAVANGNSITFYQAGSVVLGLKGEPNTVKLGQNEVCTLTTLQCRLPDSSTPEVPRCSRLLSLAAVSYYSPWDLAVTCSRLEPTLSECHVV